MGATIAGSIALYIPWLLIHKGLQAQGWLNHLTNDILRLAYVVGSPIIGALLLNWAFASALPLMPIVLCALIGGGMHLLLPALCKSSPQNGQNAAETEHAAPRRRGRVVRASRFPGRVFGDGDPFANDPFFANAMRAGFNRANRPENTGGPIIEELDEDGQVISKTPGVTRK